jgi:hypothetical protein
MISAKSLLVSKAETFACKRSPRARLSRAFLSSALEPSEPSDKARKIWRELKQINPSTPPSSVSAAGRPRHPSDAEKFTVGRRKAGQMQ